MRELGTRLTLIVERLVDGREGVTFVDNFRDPESGREPYWSADRLHLNSLGHERIASRVLTALGVPTAPPLVKVDDAGGADASRAGRVVGALGRALGRAAGEVWYWLVYVVPWLARRLLRQSSGDRRHPKFPTWVRVPSNGDPPVA